MKVRSSGVLLHVTSLPSAYGIGDMGPQAYHFIDFLKELGQTYWQILPLGPTSPALGNSPYSSFSSFAGNFMMLSPERLAEDGFLPRSDLPGGYEGDRRYAPFGEVEAWKLSLLREVYERNRFTLEQDRGYQEFCEANGHWLDDWALFSTLKERFHGRVWTDWPEAFRDRDPVALDQWRVEGADEVRFARFLQYLFFRQWDGVRRYARRRGVRLIGDAPIYVSLDSADVWTNHRLFKLGPDKRPTHVAGVPPDYFSETGQRWGNPVYNWDAMREEGYAWWLRRMEHAMRLFDFIRLDHFRGFAAYWEIDAREETAINGRWVEVPGMDFFTELTRRFTCLPIVAEDLGYITADVRELKNSFDLPGMKILQFGFGGGGSNPDAPHNHVKHCVVYTGTHDNNTTRGWFAEEASQEDRERFMEYVGRHLSEEEAAREMVRLAMTSVADTAIFPMQDLLNLGSEARMNMPSKADGFWSWRMLREEMNASSLGWFGRWTRFFGRARES